MERIKEVLSVDTCMRGDRLFEEREEEVLQLFLWLWVAIELGVGGV